MVKTLLSRLECWLHLGHDWHYQDHGEERICKRCNCWQYVATETDDGAKTWASR